MKKTTYIMIGLLLAGFLLVGGVLFWVPLLVSEEGNNVLVLEGDEVLKPLPPFRTVYVVHRPDTLPPLPELSFEEMPLRVEASEEAGGSLRYPKDLEPFVSAEVQDSVLYIAFDFSRIALDERYKDAYILKLDCGMLGLCLPSNATKLVDEMGGHDVELYNLERDTFSVNTSGNVVANYCHFGSLHAEVLGLELSSGSIDDLYLNIEQLFGISINVDQCSIGTEHLSGRYGNCSYAVSPDECREVRWEPLDEDASLDLRLQQPARVELK